MPSLITTGAMSARAFGFGPAKTYSQVIASTTSATLKNYWPLNETSGTTAFDAVGGENGTYTGGFTLGQAFPASGKGVLLNGSTGYIVTPSFVAASTPITVEFWFNLQTSSNAAYPFAFNFNLGARVQLAQSSGSISENMIFNGAVELAASSGSVGSTYHGVAVFGSAGLAFYLNGALLASNATAFITTSTSAPVYMGQNSSGAEFLTGTLSSVARYQGSMSASDVAAHYVAGLNNPG